MVSKIRSSITVPNTLILLMSYCCPTKKALKISPALAGRKIFKQDEVKHKGTISLKRSLAVFDIRKVNVKPLNDWEIITDSINKKKYFILKSFIMLINSFKSRFTKTKYRNKNVIKRRIIFFRYFFFTLTSRLNYFQLRMSESFLNIYFFA